jgi:MYXO-CTERM domain-containing protein
VQYQWQGLQIGTYSSCDIRRNILSDGPKIGVFVLGAGDTTVADNLILRFGEVSIYANINQSPGPAAYRIAHNTVVDFGEAAVQVFGDAVEGAFAWNNLVVGPPESIGAGNDVGWEMEGNLFVPSIAEAGFAAPDADDFHLTDGSPARGAGIDHTADGFDVDLDGLLRANPPSVGAYELTADSPTSGAGGGQGGSGEGAGTGTGAGSGEGGGAGGANGNPGGDPSEEGGCGCRAAGGPEGGGPLALLSLAAGALLLQRSRRRRMGP